VIRPWHIALVFSASLALLLAAIGWISWTALRFERAEAAVRQQAALEENVRLALWRMDSALAGLIAQERARPYFAYRSFYPAEAAYTRMYSESELGEVLLPSPLLTANSPYISLYFQFGPNGAASSPQIPTGRLRALAEGGYLTPAEIDAAANRLAELCQHVQAATLLAALPAPDRPAARPVVAAAPPQPPARPQAQQRADDQIAQTERNRAEFQARAQNYQQMPGQQQALLNEPTTPTEDVGVGVLQPLWADHVLLLARRVSVAGEEYVQGCWLDWDALRPWLLATAADLLGDARLEPAPTATADEGSRLLAGLPVRLVAPAPVDGATPVRPQVWLPLLVAWGCVLLAAAAVGLLLVGTVALSERRAAFVSAVTHELRTPLTTFRLYTEMLAGGLVRDAEKRGRYLATLQAEALRLGHLVENVLAYARLERRRGQTRRERVTVAQIVDRVGERLRERAAQADMQLVLETAGADVLTVRADISAVEQILFNLVDNACKYASRATDRRIHLRAGASPRTVTLAVCDHGPGVAGAERRRLFTPFHKSARDAANSAPGVGLGLALSRRLARAMGGDLRLVEQPEGACFVLALPRAPG
jgi:signal transduction histidine kinase